MRAPLSVMRCMRIASLRRPEPNADWNTAWMSSIDRPLLRIGSK
jgi:hypothetical protein